jgi:hypothetical protein
LLGLEIPGFIKVGMVACFDNTRGKVDIADILRGSEVTKEDTRKVVAI